MRITKTLNSQQVIAIESSKKNGRKLGEVQEGQEIQEGPEVQEIQEGQEDRECQEGQEGEGGEKAKCKCNTMEEGIVGKMEEVEVKSGRLEWRKNVFM